jgi:hypothetical protein
VDDDDDGGGGVGGWLSSTLETSPWSLSHSFFTRVSVRTDTENHGSAVMQHEECDANTRETAGRLTGGLAGRCDEDGNVLHCTSRVLDVGLDMVQTHNRLDQQS